MQCSYCKKKRDNLYMCSACRIAVYCNDECAHLDWIGNHASEVSHHRMNLILESGEKGNVYLGSVMAAEDVSYLKDHKVKAVLSALDEGRYPWGYIDDILDKNMFHMRITLDDDENTNIAQYFDETSRFIDEHVRAGRNVLVHCVAGQSRSTTLLIYYMVTYLGKDFPDVDDALSYIQQRRPQAQPNEGFMRQLDAAVSRL